MSANRDALSETRNPALDNVKNVTRFSDLTLECENGAVFNAHKAIVCLHSPVIARALSGEFIEAKTDTIKIDFDIGSVKCLIDFMYMGDYSLTSNSASNILERDDEPTTEVPNGNDNGNTDLQPSTTESLICHARMNNVADYYDIASLATLSREKIENILKTEWSVEYYPAFLRKTIHMTNDREFFRLLGSYAVKHIDELYKQDVFRDDEITQHFGEYMLPGCAKLLFERNILAVALERELQKRECLNW
ncbi:hypothetical protein GGR57DRAFT_519466 [Xylariaceae sp. FL1272]|nr:hypothetical protein GGR57DRAFT_519466 [Xylariaceae sp. FL1272]